MRHMGMGWKKGLLGGVALALLIQMSAALALTDQRAHVVSSPEVIFIDAGLDDLQTLLNAMRPDAEVALLDADQDGLRQMTAHLSGRQELAADHAGARTAGHGCSIPDCCITAKPRAHSRTMKLSAPTVVTSARLAAGMTSRARRRRLPVSAG